MNKAIGTWLITALAVAAAFFLVPGIGIRTVDLGLNIPGIINGNVFVPTLIFAAVLALVNSFIKPVLKLVTLPITVLTLGLFALVLNMAMLYLASWVSNSFFSIGLYISGVSSAFFASIIISIVTVVLAALTGLNRDDRDRKRDKR